MTHRRFADDPEISFRSHADLPLFGQPVPYQRGSDTSRDAAESLEGRVDLLRHRVLRAFEDAGAQGLTADQAAQAVGESVLAIRPRCSELYNAGLLRKSLLRRPNASGLLARVLVAAS